mmetsp:Transcript_1402/g.3053  ORF Transcript_1402/g.3053 Transcript_1402/m.3053 type:complete len:91 (+) Transcript_1402:691-963(+)
MKSARKYHCIVRLDRKGWMICTRDQFQIWKDFSSRFVVVETEDVEELCKWRDLEPVCPLRELPWQTLFILTNLSSSFIISVELDQARRRP